MTTGGSAADSVDSSAMIVAIAAATLARRAPLNGARVAAASASAARSSPAKAARPARVSRSVEARPSLALGR